MYRISRFDNVIPGFNIRNTTEGEVIEYEQFRDFAETFRSCLRGNKLDGYFVRGSLDPFKRLDVNLTSSNIFIIDGDQSSSGGKSPEYEEVKRHFADFGLEYAYYTTYSKSNEANKFRIVIPLSREITKPELKILAPAFVAFMNSAGLDIGYVKEMGTWSQPWFYPTREDPDDGLFEWHYKEGVPLELDSYLVEQAKKGIFGKGIVKQIQENAASDSKSIEEHLDDLTTGHYHQAIIALSFGKAKDGITFKQNLAEMRHYMKNVSSEYHDERYAERYKDLERTVKGAYDRLESEEAEEIDDYGIKFEEITDQSLPWPPGLLGELADVAMKQASFPHKEVAFVSALGLVAGIAGRKFNINSRNGLGLNVYFMLAAGTGVGKNSIVTFINRNIPTPDGGIKSSFIGPSDFTAATGLVKNHLLNARCMISVMGELGYVMESDAGNKAGKRRVMLELYTNSCYEDVLGGTAFSDEDKSVPHINSPAFSIIGESTPDKLITNILRDGSVEDGLFPRFSVFRINKINRKANRGKFETPNPIKLRIAELVETCEKIQALASFECHYLDLYDPELMYDHEDYWRGKMIDFDEAGERIKSATASRIHVKALKYAALATVFNKAKNEKNCLIIEEPEWEWAKQMVQYEMDTVSNFFQGMTSGSPLDDAATRIIGKYILIAMDKDNKSQKKLYNSMDPEMRKDRAISVSMLRQITDGQFNTSAVGGSFNAGYSQKDNFNQIIKHMEEQNYVRRERRYMNKWSAKHKDVIIVKQEFYDRLQVTRL